MSFLHPKGPYASERAFNISKMKLRHSNFLLNKNKKLVSCILSIWNLIYQRLSVRHKPINQLYFKVNYDTIFNTSNLIDLPKFLISLTLIITKGLNIHQIPFFKLSPDWQCDGVEWQDQMTMIDKPAAVLGHKASRPMFHGWVSGRQGTS